MPSLLLLLLVLLSSFSSTKVNAATKEKKEEGQEEEMSCPNGSSTCAAFNNDEEDKDPIQKWVDHFGEKTKQFLQENVFGQENIAGTNNVNNIGSFFANFGNNKKDDNGNNDATKKRKKRGGRGAGDASDGSSSNNEDEDERSFMKLFNRLSEEIATISEASGHSGERVDGKKDDKTRKPDIQSILEQARRVSQMTIGSDDEKDYATTHVIEVLHSTFLQVMDQLKETFESIIDEIEGFITISLLYYLGEEDKKKNPTWKRQQHRFYEGVTKEQIKMLHDGLYLSQLSYVNSVKEFQEGCKFCALAPAIISERSLTSLLVLLLLLQSVEVSK